MPIPQSSLSNNLSGLAASVDSSSEALSILQIIDKSIEFGDYKKFYDSAGSLPLADSAMEGSIAVVDTSSYTQYSAALYGCNGTDWNVIKFTDALPKTVTPYAGSDYGHLATGLNITDADYPTVIPTTNINRSDIRSRYAFNVDTSITEIGNMSASKVFSAGWSTSTHGYQAGGVTYTGTPYAADPTGTASSVVDKFPFSAPGSSVSVSNLTSTYSVPTTYIPIMGQSSSSIHSVNHGYVWTNGNQIAHKYQFSAESPIAITGIDIGPSADLLKSMHSDNEGYGYTSGGVAPPVGPTSSVLYASNDQWSYSSDTATGNVGSQSVNKYAQQATSSPVAGYCFFGNIPLTPTPAGNIGGWWTSTTEKFPFASLTGISVPASAPFGVERSQTWSAVDAGYVVGGLSQRVPADRPPRYNQPFSRILKLPFANETTFVAQSSSLTTSNPVGPLVAIDRGTGHQI